MCCSLIFDVPFMPAICGHSCVVTNCDDQRGFCSATFESGGTETMLVVMLARLQQFWKFWPALKKKKKVCLLSFNCSSFNCRSAYLFHIVKVQRLC